jgi:hypothetical protein
VPSDVTPSSSSSAEDTDWWVYLVFGVLCLLALQLGPWMLLYVVSKLRERVAVQHKEEEKRRKRCGFRWVPASFLIKAAANVGKPTIVPRVSRIRMQSTDALPTWRSRRIDVGSLCARLRSWTSSWTSWRFSWRVNAKVHAAEEKVEASTRADFFSFREAEPGEKILQELNRVRDEQGPEAARQLASKDADVLGALTYAQLWRHGVLRPIEVETDTFDKDLTSRHLAVSHRWITSESPDAAPYDACAQLDVIADHLKAHPEVEFVWYDWVAQRESNAQAHDPLAAFVRCSPELAQPAEG